VSYASSIVTQPDFTDMISQALGMLNADKLLDWPIAELTIYWVISLILYPLFSLFITADQISSDRARGTLRFLVLRSTRFELFIGRYLGQMLILTILVFATVSAASGMAVYRDASLLSHVPLNISFILFHLFVVLLPVVAITALTSVVCQSARSATFLAIIGLSASFILTGVAIHYFPKLAFLDDYLIGAQVSDLAISVGLTSLNHISLPIAQALVILAIAYTLFNRKAL
jgi:ABC-type transport system involved in multi-copper enzyme maturation permease subunit